MSRVTIKNIGTYDAKIEYIILNGNITFYATITFGTITPFNYLKGEYLVLLPGSQVQLLLFTPINSSQNQSSEVKLHTTSGNDYVKTMTFSC